MRRYALSRFLKCLSFPSVSVGNPGFVFYSPLLCKEGLGEVEYKLDLPHPTSPYKGEGSYIPKYNSYNQNLDPRFKHSGMTV